MRPREALYGYQPPAVAFVKATKRCLLFIDPGLGKTVICTTAFLDLMNDFLCGMMLIVAPPNVCKKTWQAEITAWMHTHEMSYVFINGSPAKRKKLLKRRACFHIVSMEMLPWLLVELGGRAPNRRRIKQLLLEQPEETALIAQGKHDEAVELRNKINKEIADLNKWRAPVNMPYSGIIVDESSKVKSHDTNRFRALSLMAFRVEYFIELTGTPRPNGLHDLWSQVFLIDRGARLGHNITAFRERWFTQNYTGHGYKAKDYAFKKIEEAIADIVYTLREEDYANLPPRMYNNVNIPMPPEIMEKYKRFERTLILEAIGKNINVISGAALRTKLRQLSNGVVYDNDKGEHFFHDVKLEALQTLVDETYGEPLLVAYQFKTDIERITKWFEKQFPVKLFDGKAATEDAWNRGEYRMMLVHENSAAHGLNLQFGGRHAVWFALSDSLEAYIQLNKRLHRSGQKFPVVIHHLIVESTIDEDILEGLEWKDNEQEAFLNALKKRIKLYKPEFKLPEIA